MLLNEGVSWFHLYPRLRCGIGVCREMEKGVDTGGKVSIAGSWGTLDRWWWGCSSHCRVEKEVMKSLPSIDNRKMGLMTGYC